MPFCKATQEGCQEGISCLLFIICSSMVVVGVVVSRFTLVRETITRIRMVFSLSTIRETLRDAWAPVNLWSGVDTILLSLEDYLA